MNQFNRAWNFYAKNWKFFIVLAAPIMMLEIAMASMVTPIQNVTQPEDILEFFNENIVKGCFLIANSDIIRKSGFVIFHLKNSF